LSRNKIRKIRFNLVLSNVEGQFLEQKALELNKTKTQLIKDLIYKEMHEIKS
jgi:hypothetical protein